MLARLDFLVFVDIRIIISLDYLVIILWVHFADNDWFVRILFEEVLEFLIQSILLLILQLCFMLINFQIVIKDMQLIDSLHACFRGLVRVVWVLKGAEELIFFHHFFVPICLIGVLFYKVIWE